MSDHSSSFTIVNNFPAPLTFVAVDSLGENNKWDEKLEPPQSIAAGATSSVMKIKTSDGMFWTARLHDKLPAVATSATITYRTRVNGVSFTIAFSVSCPVNEINTTAVDYIPSTVGYRSKTEPSNYLAKPLVVKFTVST